MIGRIRRSNVYILCIKNSFFIMAQVIKRNDVKIYIFFFSDWLDGCLMAFFIYPSIIYSLWPFRVTLKLEPVLFSFFFFLLRLLNMGLCFSLLKHFNWIFIHTTVRSTRHWMGSSVMDSCSWLWNIECNLTLNIVRMSQTLVCMSNFFVYELDSLSCHFENMTRIWTLP